MSNFSLSQEHATSLDAADSHKHFRSKFIIPTKADLKRPTLAIDASEAPSEPCIYLCGNSLGLQPRRVRQRIETFLTQWSTKAVTGHFVDHEDSTLSPFLHIDDRAATLMAPIVGALESEIAVMGTLTANLHLMMSSFYKPTKEKFKIILEGKAFPSDHYAIESQIAQNGYNPYEAMILLSPASPNSPTLATADIIATIDAHAHETALILLPGVQFYTGQYFDIPTINAHAHSKGILIGWDCAHAVGNVELKLHDWDVDFAVWCTYKYLNAGPGAMAGIFVNERHGRVDMSARDGERFRPRLAGWWGADKATRFLMDNDFVPRPGAAGYQLSNPSALDLSAVVASLEVFNETSMAALRKKSLGLTKYLEDLLNHSSFDPEFEAMPFTIITPLNSEERGAQLSIRLQPGLLDSVLEYLSENGVVVDERKPDVVRVAPAPMYNTYEDVWKFCQVFTGACKNALATRENAPNGIADAAGERPVAHAAPPSEFP